MKSQAVLHAQNRFDAIRPYSQTLEPSQKQYANHPHLVSETVMSDRAFNMPHSSKRLFMEQRKHSRIRSKPVQRDIKELGEDAQEIYKAATYLAGLEVILSREYNGASVTNDSAGLAKIQQQYEALKTARKAVDQVATVWLEKPAQFVLVSNMGYCDDFYLVVDDEQFRTIEDEDADQDQA
jgi:hypothetical protein